MIVTTVPNETTFSGNIPVRRDQYPYCTSARQMYRKRALSRLAITREPACRINRDSRSRNKVARLDVTPKPCGRGPGAHREPSSPELTLMVIIPGFRIYCRSVLSDTSRGPDHSESATSHPRLLHGDPRIWCQADPGIAMR